MYRVCPSARSSGEVPPTRVPLNVRHAIVVRGTELLNPRAPLLFRLVILDQVVRIEVEVPELELRLERRADRREHDVVSAQGAPMVFVVRPASVPAMRRDGVPASTPKKYQIPEHSRRS